ncbi:hypothetical protein Plhal304r1_c012g0047741 [Plasmopara halstedii]
MQDDVGGTKPFEICSGVLSTVIVTNTLHPVASFVLCDGLEFAKAIKNLCSRRKQKHVDVSTVVVDEREHIQGSTI